MYKVTILEDEPRQRERELAYLHRYEEAHPEVSFSIETYERGVLLLDQYRCDADFLLLDIRVPDMLGMEVARRIRQMDERVVILFVTNLTEYAVEGYSVQAFDYILKPIAYPSFEAKLSRVIRLLNARSAAVTVQIKTKEGTQRISAEDILYLEVVNHDVYFHMGSGAVLRQWGSLSKYEELLKESHFARCNACYLVNLKFVRGISGESVLVGETELAVSGPRRRDFLSALAQYKGGSRV
jgi:DNA-binding LytR/AlgR family response regulator